jgi:hypothetical protein
MKKKDLNNCTCGKYPEIIKGKHNILEKIIFSVGCKNKNCKAQPKTEDCLTLRHAKEQWNKNIVTDSLF